MAAVLHDVTEDTAFTAQMLLDLGVPEAAVEIVKLLDRDYSLKGYTIDFWDQPRDKDGADAYYYAAIKTNPGAVQVKLADIHDNLQEWRLSYLPEATQDRLRAKNAKAREFLKRPTLSLSSKGSIVF
jgi:(p)ppGpp synthase/HD superfamily hydrolase